MRRKRISSPVEIGPSPAGQRAGSRKVLPAS